MIATRGSRAGSWPPLLGLVVAFLLLFAWQRSRSTFLRIEADREAAGALAAEHGLTVAEVFALRDLVGVDAAAGRWQAAVARFAADGGFAGADPALLARRFEMLRDRFGGRDAAR
ncbi:MAG: hypothetical protein H6835_01235 [Planctomycetes bacterium]|nr:hypothetical protein [Planctomycetota bacterium]